MHCTNGRSWDLSNSRNRGTLCAIMQGGHRIAARTDNTPLDEFTAEDQAACSCRDEAAAIPFGTLQLPP
jgi:hypothetical protein